MEHSSKDSRTSSNEDRLQIFSSLIVPDILGHLGETLVRLFGRDSRATVASFISHSPQHDGTLEYNLGTTTTCSNSHLWKMISTGREREIERWTMDCFTSFLIVPGMMGHLGKTLGQPLKQLDTTCS